MNGKVREQIREFDVMTGGGIISDKIRIDKIDNPVLIIGIGGTGIDALLRVKYQINRRFNLPEDEITKVRKEKPNGVEFLAFETNAYEKNKNFRGIGLDPQSELVLLSNAQIGSILNDREILDDCIKEWLSPELSISDGMQGANGNRQAGRLLLFTKINEVVESIRKKIWNVMQNTNEKLEVFILTGISGGTGSGSFIDIAYLVRGLIQEKFGDQGIDKVNVLGYLFTPDVNLSKNPEINARSYIIKNGYAALKEVDYLMNIPERGDRFVQNYKNFKVDSPSAPFDVCHLISATNKQGKILENGYEYSMNVTAEIITNFISNEQRESGQEFAIHDWLSNVPTLINQMPKPYKANYKYVIIGASAAVLPIEEITTYLGCRLFDKMNKMFEKSPTEQEVDQFIKTVKLDASSIEGRFEKELFGKKPLSGYANREKFNFDNVIKKQSINVDDELSAYLREAIDEYSKVNYQYPGEMSKIIRENIDRMFKDANKGPFYASRMLFTDKGFNAIKTIEVIIEGLEDKRRSMPELISELKDRAEDKFGEARKALLSRETKKNDYIKAKIEEYNARADEEKLSRMIDFYHRVIEIISHENNVIYHVYTEILNELNKIFKEDADILVKSHEENNLVGGKTYYWNVIEVPDVVKSIDEIVDSQDADEVIRRFTSTLLEESQKWIDDEKVDITGSISKFVSDQFESIITKSMEEFIVMKYGEEKSIEDFVRKTIAPKLDDDAIPVFQLNDAGSSFTFPSWDMVSVPMRTPRIKKGIEQYKMTSTHGSQVNVRQSKVTNRIFWLNTEVGVPLYSYAPIKQYEQEYEKTILKQDGIGRHLVQNRNNNWAYLPSPIPEASWGVTYDNERVRNYNNDIRELFDKAVKYECIVMTDSQLSSKYKCVITKDFDVNSVIKKYELGIEEGETPSIGEINKCLMELRKIMKEKSLTKVEFADNQKYFIFDSRDEEAAKESFLRAPRLIELIRKEVLKYSSIEDEINKLQAYVSEVNKKTKIVNDFLQALYTDTICKKGIVYIYDKDEDEKTDVPPFLNIMKQKEYVEFYIFNKYKELEDKEINVINAKAEKRFNDLSMKEEGPDIIYKKISAMAASFSKYVEELEYRKFEFENGDEIYNFYVIMLEKVKELKKTLE